MEISGDKEILPFAEEPRASNWHGYCGSWPRI
jgi:hypothetical protein